ncbi:hypothetical protein SAMN02745166_04202 [Prosthecobacter debontii]|uniref:Uncharacterized protein n=1 Tax=Prosthecobacter debontii TaxID=48467 RepID=A0A1T4YVD7_9BACT|nr:hypothetical protein [Prosthecobacter debontii]SKB05205.1 hypothetical protein SAMN02745166_04202 [Prosthecobacter debontii]
MRRARLLILNLCFPVLLALATPLWAQVQTGRELVMLDARNNVHDIAINATVATTITFPEKITLLTGFGLVTDPNAGSQLTQSKVALVHYENVADDTLVVRLVKPGDPCHATLRTNRHIYLLRFVPSEAANLAVIVPPPEEKNAAVPVSGEQVVQNRIHFDSEELVGMLSKVKSRKALQTLNPGLFSGWQERNGLDMASTSNGVKASIYEIHRNPAKDLMAFRCWLTNDGTETYEFEPTSVRVRVGERTYDAQLVDCSGLVPPGKQVPMDVVLQGGPGGVREGLSINQDFRIELPAPGRTQISNALFGNASAEDGK